MSSAKDPSNDPPEQGGAPQNSNLGALESRHSKDSWKGQDIELARQDGMLDIATERPVVPAFKERSLRSEIIIGVFGLIALASPLALWIAWTQEMLLIVSGAGLVSTLICWLTVRFSDAD